MCVTDARQPLNCGNILPHMYVRTYVLRTYIVIDLIAAFPGVSCYRLPEETWADRGLAGVEGRSQYHPGRPPDPKRQVGPKQDTFHTCLFNGEPLPDPHYGEQPLYGFLCQSRLGERTFSVDLAEEGPSNGCPPHTYVGEGVGRRPSIKKLGAQGLRWTWLKPA